jgi:dTDP-glucose 4,6-dehydratase
MKEKEVALVAGAAGFVGSHLSEALLHKGINVIGVDNFVTGSEDNVEILSKNEDFEFIRHDISTPLPDVGQVNYVYDMACPASPTDFDRLKMEILLAGSLGVYNLLEYSKDHNAQFVFSSSSEVYGDPLENPQKESYRGNVNTLGIRAIYDEGKRYGEAMTMTYNRKYDLDTRIVRIFNTYGERMRSDDGRAIPTFISQAVQNKNITVFGDGSQTRSPQYVSDLVTGIIALSESNIEEPVNIGNPAEMTLTELAQLIISLANSKSKIQYIPLIPEDDPKKRKPDITRAKKILNWEPIVTPQVGLLRTIEWFKLKLQNI